MSRTSIVSSSGSYAGRIAPPGRPNTTSTPTSSSARTRAWAPVIRVLPGALGVGVGAGVVLAAAPLAVGVPAPAATWATALAVPLAAYPAGPEGAAGVAGVPAVAVAAASARAACEASGPAELASLRASGPSASRPPDPA